MSMQHRFRLRVVTFGALLGLALAGPTVAAAQQDQQSPAAPNGETAPAEDVFAARLRVSELQQQLEGIRNRALESSPSLQEQQQALQQKVNERMEARGVDPQADLERLREIATQLRNESLAEAEQQELADEYRQKRQRLLEARNAVLGDEEIRQAREQFGQELLVAMKEVEPDVEQVIRRYNEAQAEFRRKMEAAHQGMQSH